VLRLDGKVAIVTGCGSSGPGWGNGKAMAVLLARQGAKIAGFDRDEAAAAETKRISRTRAARASSPAATPRTPRR
jgi:NAD(P)-dependent dehydrogenase (short-subunit alcohol dehydrogenase family)